MDFHRCQSSLLADVARVREVMLASARDSGATIIDSHFHEFSPQGISGVVVITESHFAVHTWPEYGFAAVDIFTCGKSIDFDRAIAVLEEGFQASVVSMGHPVERGTMPSPTPHTADGPTSSVTSWREKFEREQAGNLFAMIDVEGCAPRPSVEAVRAFLSSARELLGITSDAEPSIQGTDDGPFIVFTLAGANAVVSGRIANATRYAYISVMSSAFFEPSVIAATAIRHLSGTRYSFHVGINP